VDLPAAPCPVLADPDRLEQVLANLNGGGYVLPQTRTVHMACVLAIGAGQLLLIKGYSSPDMVTRAALPGL